MLIFQQNNSPEKFYAKETSIIQHVIDAVTSHITVPRDKQGSRAATEL